MSPGYIPVLACPYDNGDIVRDPTTDRPTLDPRIITPPPALGTINSLHEMPQQFIGDPHTGEVGWLGPWKTTRNLRRRSEWRANSLTPDFRSHGGEGSVTLGGTGSPTAPSNQPIAVSPIVRITTENGTTGKSATATTNLGIFRWDWDATITFLARTVLFTKARYWLAATSATLDQVLPAEVDTDLGAGGRMAGFCVDAFHFGNLNLRCVTWDGTDLVITDTGVDMTDEANDFMVWTMEVDEANAEVRFYRYNRVTGVNSGLIATHDFASFTTFFGLQAVVEVSDTAPGALSLDLSLFACEHKP